MILKCIVVIRDATHFEIQTLFRNAFSDIIIFCSLWILKILYSMILIYKKRIYGNHCHKWITIYTPLLTNSLINIIRSRHEDESQGRIRERSTWNRLLLYGTTHYSIDISLKFYRFFLDSYFMN